MTVIQTADGKLLRARPANLNRLQGGGGFRPLWSSGDPYNQDPDSRLASYDYIYRTQPAIAGCVDKLAKRIATLPFDSFEEDGEDRKLVRGDTLDSLIRRPMPRHATVHLLAHISTSLFTHGNALVAKVRGSDPDAPPEMLWPLDWSKVSAYAEPGGTIEWWSTTQFGDQERFLNVADTMHFAWPATDSEIGVSPLEKLGVTIRLEDATQRYQTASFRNGARPGGVITLPTGSNPNPEVMAETRRTAEDMHKGVDKAFKIGLLAPGADWKPIQQSAVEVELIDQRRLNREEVGMVYDLAGPLMNDLTHGTYSNLAELNKALYRDVLPPQLVLIQQTFQAQLIDPEPAWMGRFTAFDLGEKLRGDPVELANALKTQVEAGLQTRNEARRVLNLPPDGDPKSTENPANRLTANINNQATLAAMSAGDPPVEQ